jgi:hypothetical protein
MHAERPRRSPPAPFLYAQDYAPLLVAANVGKSCAYILTKWSLRSQGPWHGQAPSGR